ncbi:uncharacterized protein KGF55_000276 [Candida pseudojiufengensis]|uniref:uncharacterized protein n=1 Tax=Candida pseudojiufengensis TaxID=497109 RepID=UPI0022250DE3|nr:uncharacterized protein KGF55_000276 [Candida pseudojiufengensis]KAI5966867.1 hypothetical protein KGF55_000276 [Candida pseudojiufengensis]
MSTSNQPYITSILEEEINEINNLLTSIPFTSEVNNYFLNLYKLSYKDLSKLNELNNQHKFPINSQKLLKLSISLGNLIKIFENDEENFKIQNHQQNSFLKKLNNSNGGGGNGNGKLNQPLQPSQLQPSQFPSKDPFQTTNIPTPNIKHIINSDSTQQQQETNNLTKYEIRFIKNLFTILKNFDLNLPQPPPQQQSSVSDFKRDSYTSLNSSSLSNPQTPKRNNNSSTSLPTSNTSPIKLNSKQLLIEKLEININLDILFIYKINLKLILEILNKLLNIIKDIKIDSSNQPQQHQQLKDNMSIFSINSINSNDSSSILNFKIDENLKIIENIVVRIKFNILKPFIQLIFKECIESNLNNEFNSLINSL